MIENLIEIGDFSVERKRRFSLKSEQKCQHRRLVLEEVGEVVRCRDCKTQVSAYWAISKMLEGFQRQKAELAHERARLADVRGKSIHLIAARAVEKAWRSKDMVPTCPHCNAGILPTDRFGASMINKSIEARRRANAR